MKLKVLLTVFLLSSTLALGASQFAATISRIENSILGVDYSNQKDAERLERIEKTVYGTSSKGSIGERLKRLNKDLATDQMGSEIEPARDTFAYEEEKADPSVNYPIVNQLEEKVFKKTYAKLDIRTRLSKLEQQTFSKTFVNDDLNTRVSRLKDELIPQRFDYSDNSIAQAPDEFFMQSPFQNFSPYTQSYNAETYPMPQTPQRFNYPTGGAANLDNNYINQLEKAILKKNYQAESTAERIERMESKLFKTNFSEDDFQTRLDRLSSAYNAQKSSAKYEGGKFQKHLSTAIQVGAIVLMIIACIL